MINNESKDSTYHHDLGKALAELLKKYSDTHEVGYVGEDIRGEAIIDTQIDYVELGHYVSEAISVTGNKELTK